MERVVCAASALVKGQLAAERDVDEESLFPVDLMIKIQEWIVAAAAHRGVRGVTCVDLQRMLGARRCAMLRDVATQRCQHSGLQQHVRRSAQHSGHRILIHEGPTHCLHVDVAVRADEQLQPIQNYSGYSREDQFK